MDDADSDFPTFMKLQGVLGRFRELTLDLQREPTAAEMAAEYGISTEDAAVVLERLRWTGGPIDPRWKEVVAALPSRQTKGPAFPSMPDLSEAHVAGFVDLVRKKLNK